MQYVRSIIIALVVIACGGAIYLAYDYLSDVQENRYKAKDILPDNIILVYQTDKMMDDWRRLNGTSMLWEQTRVHNIFPVAQKELGFMDSILIKDSKLEQFLNKHTATFSVHYFNQKIEHLFALELDVNDDKKSLLQDLLAVLPEHYKVKEKQLSGETFRSIDTGGETWLLGFNHNILLLSQSEELIAKTFKSPEKNDILNELVDMRGTGFDVQGNLYMNYSLLHLYFKNNLATSPLSHVDLKAWSLSDINVGPQSIQLSGLLKFEDQAFLANTKDLVEKNMSIYDKLPASLSAFVAVGLPEHSTIPAVLKMSDHSQSGFEQAILDSDLRLNSDIAHQLFSWLGSEGAVAWDDQQSKFLVFSTDPSVSRIHDLIQDYAQASLKYESKEVDTSVYRNFHITNAILQVQYSSYAGDLFEMPEEVWFASNQENVIVAESKESLKAFIKSARTARFSEVHTTETESLLASQAFGFLYVNPSKTGILKSFLNEEQYAYLEEKMAFFNELGFVGIQFAKAKDALALNMVISSQQNLIADKADLWDLELPARAGSKMDLIFNHRSKTYNYVIQDTANALHLISNTGQLIWSKQLDGPYLGEVRQIDIYDNKKLQMVLNTASTLYVVDILGRDVKHFPVKFPATATAPLAVFDYENKHEYRLVVPSGRQLLNYNTDGESTRGWKFDAAEAPIALTPIHEVIEGKDYIMVPDDNGKFYILNRQGEQAEFEEGILSQLNAFNGQSFFIEKSSSLATSKVIYLDTNNTVYMQYLGGQTDSISTLGSSKEFQLAFEDVDGDNFKDYVVYGNGKIMAFRKDKQKLFVINKRQCDESYVRKFKAYWVFALYDSVSQEMYLFDKNGDQINEDALNATPAVIRGDFNDDGEIELIYGIPKRGLKCSYPR